jgi:hypothetical protein
LLHEMKPELPLPPLDLPRLFLFFVILNTNKGAARACLKGWGTERRVKLEQVLTSARGNSQMLQLSDESDYGRGAFYTLS